MRKLTTFTFITLNGFYKGMNEDISWHKHGNQENEFAASKLSSPNTLLFGRVTYDMMQSWWPTPMAMEQDPVVAKGMNEAEKIVFSTTLKKADWGPTTIIRKNIVDEIKKLKQQKGQDLTLLGSGSILSQLAEHNLVDEYQIMIDPVAIGEGDAIFHAIHNQLDLKLVSHQVFKSGVILVCYQPQTTN